MYISMLLTLREELKSKIQINGHVKEEDTTADHRKTEEELEYSSPPSISTYIAAPYFFDSLILVYP